MLAKISALYAKNISPVATLYRRECHRLFQSNVIAIVVVLLLLIMGALFFLRFFDGPQTLDLRLFFGNAPMLLAFFCPAITMGLLAQERSANSLEWLQSLPISSLQLVVAKFLAACTLLFTALLFTLSYPLSLAMLGPLDWGPVIGAYLALFLLSASFLAVGLWSSALGKDQVVAVLVGFFICFGLSFVDRLAPETGLLSSILYGLSASRHFQSITRGVIDFRDILYMLSLIIFALSATTLQLTAHKYPQTKHPQKSPHRTSRTRYYLQAISIVALLAMALALLNALFNQRASMRWDLTREGRYSLSDATKQALDQLGSKLSIKVYYSPDLPEIEQQNSRRLRDTLEEYSAYTDLFTYEFIEPRTEADENAAQGFGLRKLSIGQKERDQIAVRRIFKGMVLMLGGQAEVIPEFRTTDSPEYLITKSILNLTRSKAKNIGILQGFGGMGEQSIFLDSTRELFNEVYGKLIALQTISVTPQCTLSTPVEAILILNIERPLNDCALYALDQALMHNSSLAVYQSPTAADPLQPDQPRMRVDTGLTPLLMSYGFELRPDLVLDRTHNIVGKELTQDGSIPVSLPALPILTRIDKQSAITQNLAGLIFPFTGSIGITPTLQKIANAQITQLVQSSDDAVARPAGGDISWDSLNRARSDEQRGPFTLAVAATLAVQSYFTDRQKPSSATEFLPSNPAARLLLVSCGDFLFSQNYIGYTEELARYGVHFFINGMDWLAQDETLTQIRNRDLPSLLPKIDENTKNHIIYLNIFGIPALALLLIAILRLSAWAKRARIRRIYAGTQKT